MKTSRFNNKVRVFYKEKQQSITGQIISNLIECGLQFAYIKYNSGKEVIKSGIIESNLNADEYLQLMIDASLLLCEKLTKSVFLKINQIC